jgi:hypothetical protein
VQAAFFGSAAAPVRPGNSRPLQPIACGRGHGVERRKPEPCVPRGTGEQTLVHEGITVWLLFGIRLVDIVYASGDRAPVSAVSCCRAVSGMPPLHAGVTHFF